MKRRTVIKAVFGVVASVYAPAVLRLRRPTQLQRLPQAGDHVREIAEKVELDWVAGDWIVPCPNCFDINVVRLCKQHNILKCCDCGLIWDERVLAERAMNMVCTDRRRSFVLTREP